jgi:hypothetical protein
MGRSLVRGILNSARGLSDKDNSPEAQNARRIAGFADLDGIEFVARIDVGTDSNGEEKNDIRSAVTRDHKDYAVAMGGHAAAPSYVPAPSHAGTAQTSYPPPNAPHHAAPQPQPAPAAGVRPTWAR